MLTPIVSFSGEYGFLSNFFPVEIVGPSQLTYQSVEHAYQASKSLRPIDHLKLARSVSAVQAKRWGRKLAIREDWESVKIDVMRDLLRKKFQNPVLREWLKATAPRELVEGNYWNDTFWGVCNGVGENHLGKLLMEERDR